MAVDFVYGSFPIQPNTGRKAPVVARAQDTPLVIPSTDVTLNPDLDSHNVVYDSYNGYPANDPKEPMPDLAGLSISYARQVLQKAGFVLGTITTDGAQGEGEADPVVVTQSVEAGTISDRWTVVDISTVLVEDPEVPEDPEAP